MDEGLKRQQVERGHQAKILLENELFVEAFEKMETALMQSWKYSTPEETEAREDAWRSIQLLNNLREHISHIAHTGEFAKKELLELEQSQTREAK